MGVRLDEFPGISREVNREVADATWLDCTIEAADGTPLNFEMYQPHVNVLALPGEAVEPLPAGQVETVTRLAEEGPCGGVNMAELVLDKLIDKAAELREAGRELRLHGNHPPSKGAERAALYEAAGVDFKSPLEAVPPGSVYLFSAHGADPRLVDVSRTRGHYVVDTTCTLVHHIYRGIRNLDGGTEPEGSDYEPHETGIVYLAPLYDKDPKHPEMQGTRGVAETAGFRFIPVRNAAEAVAPFVSDTETIGPEQVSFKGLRRLLVTGLTTNNALEVAGIARAVSQAAAGSDVAIRRYNERDVCRTVQFRQEGIHQVVRDALAKTVVIVGALGSNNTNEQVRVVADAMREAAPIIGTDQLPRRLIFANHFSQLPPDIAGDVAVTSGASTQQTNVDQILRRLNPRKVETVGRSEKNKLFRPVGGRTTLAGRILEGDFSWLDERPAAA